MSTILPQKVKIIPIGNSKGIRIPAETIKRYHFDQEITVKELPDGVFLQRPSHNKLNWEETFKSMAKEKEDWSDFETTTADGIE